MRGVRLRFGSAAALLASGALVAGMTVLPAAASPRSAAPSARPPAFPASVARPFAGGCEIARGPAGPGVAAERQFHVSGQQAASGSTGLLPGCGHPARRIRGAAGPGGVISGTVTDSRGQSLSQVTVLADDAYGDQELACSTDTGSFSITHLPRGRYTITFAHLRACKRAGNWAPQYFPDRANPADAVAVAVRPGQRVTGIDAVMQPGSTLTGRVTSRAGLPLRGICVGAISPGGAPFVAREDALGTAAKTSRDGTYRITNLATGRYSVQFNGCFRAGYANHWFGSRPGHRFGSVVDVGTAQTVGGISTVMPPGGNIVTTMQTRAGQGVNDCAEVTSLDTGATFYATGFYSYIFAGLAPGGYRVEFSTCGEGNYATQWFNRKSSPRTATIVRVRAGASRQVGSALTPGGRLSGRATSKATGRPVANICVTAFTASGIFFGYGVTGRHGNYVVPGLNTGTYHLEVFNCGNGEYASARLTRAVHVTVPRTVSGVRISVPTGGSVSGAVQMRSPAAAGPGGVCVEADPVTAGGVAEVSQSSYTGRYVLRDLRAGRYKIYFDTGSCDNGFAPVMPQWYRAAATRAAATAVTVHAGRNTTGIDARLQVSGGISGRIAAAASGAPLGGICIRAVPRAATRTVSVTASTAGRYALIGLAPGRYTVEFSSGCGTAGYAIQWWRHAPSAAKATVITVRANTISRGIDATMTR
jgi:hypothetical protein